MPFEIDIGMGLTSLPVVGGGAGSFPVNTSALWEADDDGSIDRNGAVNSWGRDIPLVNTGAPRPSYFASGGPNDKPYIRFQSAALECLHNIGSPADDSWPLVNTHLYTFMLIRKNALVDGQAFFATINDDVAKPPGTVGDNDFQQYGGQYVIDTNTAAAGSVSARWGFDSPLVASTDVSGGWRFLEFHHEGGSFNTIYAEGAQVGQQVSSYSEEERPTVFSMGSRIIGGAETAPYCDMDVCLMAVVGNGNSPLAAGTINMIRNYVNMKYFPESPFVYLP